MNNILTVINLSAGRIMLKISLCNIRTFNFMLCHVICSEFFVRKFYTSRHIGSVDTFFIERDKETDTRKIAVKKIHGFNADFS